jgi:hypothetical protein
MPSSTTENIAYRQRQALSLDGKTPKPQNPYIKCFKFELIGYLLYK